jgi:hypothetical protein
MSLYLATLFFAIIWLNVGLGSFGGKAFLSDVGEMLVLFAATIFFVVAILKREAAAKGNDK